MKYRTHRWAGVLGLSMSCLLVWPLCPSAMGQNKAKDVSGDKGQAKPKKSAEPKSETAVVRYVGAEKGMVSGNSTLVVTVAPPLGGKGAAMIVPNTDPNAYTPSPQVAGALKKLKKDDLFSVTFIKVVGVPNIQSVAPYSPKYGEEEPDAYIFLKAEEVKVGDQDYYGIRVKKYETPLLFLVPNVRDMVGKLVSDAEVSSQVLKIKPDTLVQVDLEKSDDNYMLKAIRPFGDPVEVEVARIVEENIAGNPNLSLIAVRINKLWTLAVPLVKEGTKFTPDRKLAEKVKALKPGQKAMAKVFRAGGKMYLADITPQGTPSSTPAGKEN